MRSSRSSSTCATRKSSSSRSSGSTRRSSCSPRARSTRTPTRSTRCSSCSRTSLPGSSRSPRSTSASRDEVLALERAGHRRGARPGPPRRRSGRPPAVRRLMTRATMARVRGLLTFSLLLGMCACSRPAAARPRRPLLPRRRPRAKPRCAYPAGWQKLANKIKAPVYCPGWLPDPLTGQIGGKWNNINDVSPDRSYLESFVWQETGGGVGGGELHVNLRGYPGRTKIPTCRTGGVDSRTCRASTATAGRSRRTGSPHSSTRPNQDTDAWHAALLWRKGGTLYTLSEHVAPPLTYNHVVRYLKQELASLVLIKPALMKLTRRQVVVGAAAGARRRGRDLRAGRPASAAARPQRAGSEASRSPSSICSTASGSSTRRASRCSCRRSTTRSSRRVSPSGRADLRVAQAELEQLLAGLDTRLRAVAGRPRRHRRLGPAVLRPPDARCAAAPPPARPPRGQAGAVRRGALPERSVRHTPRVERRRDPAALRHARAHRRRDEAPHATRSSSS